MGKKKRAIIQDGWVGVMEDLPPKDSPEYWAVLVETQNKIRERFERFLKSEGMVGLKLSRFSVWLYWDKTFRLSIVPRTGTREDSIDFKLFNLLDALPHTTIQKCPGCQKFFLNLSLRKKKYCSSRCMWRISTEKRRQADPEGYRKRQRELMRKIYRKKLAKTRGVPEDKVKIQKRDRKKRDWTKSFFA